MNRKILIALLVIPLLVFAADQAFTAFRADGGEKEKVKSESPQQPEANAEAVTNAAPEEHPAPVLKSKKPPAKAVKSNQAELVRELKNERKTLREEYYDMLDEDGKLLWPGSEAVSEATRNFLDKNVLKKLKKANPMSISLEKSFSRCPTAYHYSLMTDKNKNLSGEGWMILEDGCDDQPVAVFRYDKALTKVEVKVSDKAGYVSMEEFFVLLKKAES